MNYTKREWKAFESRVIIPNKEGFVSSPQWPHFVVAQTSTYCNPDGEEARTNAHLIAAAPDMYEVLKLTIKKIDPFSDNPREVEVFEMASKALAKAEGN